MILEWWNLFNFGPFLNVSSTKWMKFACFVTNVRFIIQTTTKRQASSGKGLENTTKQLLQLYAVISNWVLYLRILNRCQNKRLDIRMCGGPSWRKPAKDLRGYLELKYTETSNRRQGRHERQAAITFDTVVRPRRTSLGHGDVQQRHGQERCCTRFARRCSHCSTGDVGENAFEALTEFDKLDAVSKWARRWWNCAGMRTRTQRRNRSDGEVQRVWRTFGRAWTRALWYHRVWTRSWISARRRSFW